jgi:nucleotide-binding universal stress UspA family protein
MSVVVGYTPNKGGRGSLDLGLQLAHALDEPMAVVTVVPRQWSTPSMARVDAEYGEYARQVGEEAERQARAYLSDTTVTVEVSYRAVTGRSIASALIDAVGHLDASVLVLGSSADGQVGRVVVGSTADKLLHASPVALAISPREFRSIAAEGVTKVTCAFSDSHTSVAVVGRVHALAERFGVPLRVASFGVRGATMYPPVTGVTAEDSVLDSWIGQAQAAQRRLVAGGDPRVGRARNRHRGDVERHHGVDPVAGRGGARPGLFLDGPAGARVPRLPRDEAHPARARPRDRAAAPGLTASAPDQSRVGQRIRTDRQVAQPSRRSNSLMSTVTTSSPREA